MAISRRDVIAGGTAGALAALAASGAARAADQTQENAAPESFPMQAATDRAPDPVPAVPGGYDPRNDLAPRRLAMAMWDQAYVLRHGPGGSFEDHDRVLDETVERGYNTLRIDPMPQWIDLRRPARVLAWADPKEPFMPWCWNTAVKAPVGQWVIEFMEKLLRRPSLHYTLSAWWSMPATLGDSSVPAPLRRPANMTEGAEMWARQLTDWKRRFGFDRLIYVDIANETPYFFPDLEERLKKATGAGFDDLASFSAAQSAFLSEEIGRPLALLRREFPELRFTTSIHGDLRWLDVPLELDCLDAHFYADADPRWSERTRFDDFIAADPFKNDRGFAEFSDRAVKTAAAMAPMLRARQRYRMTEFAGWRPGEARR